MQNGRCRNHGGLSSGPKTPEGKAAVGRAAQRRYYEGGLEALETGYKRWLEAGGREVLSQLAKRRWRLQKYREELVFGDVYTRTRRGVKGTPRLGRTTPRDC